MSDETTMTEGARFAPWLVLLSGHLPLTSRSGGVVCSCGSSLYVGHLPRLLADCADRLHTDRSAHNAEMAAARDADRVARRVEGGGL